MSLTLVKKQAEYDLYYQVIFQWVFFLITSASKLILPTKDIKETKHMKAITWKSIYGC